LEEKLHLNTIDSCGKASEGFGGLAKYRTRKIIDAIILLFASIYNYFLTTRMITSMNQPLIL